VVQGSDRAGFNSEALTEAFGRNFDGDIAVKARVMGAVDLAHPTLSDTCKNLVGAEFVAGREGHALDSV
jgi:hypothetical protein